MVSTRLTQKEFEEAIQEAKRYNLKFKKYTRLKITNGELRIKEFIDDKTLLDYGNNFIRIKNMFRRSEFSQLDHPKVILSKVEEVTKLIYDYLYNKMNSRTEGDFREDE